MQTDDRSKLNALRKREQKQLEKLQRAYATVMGSVEGRMVLGDILRSLEHRNVESADPNELLRLSGARRDAGLLTSKLRNWASAHFLQMHVEMYETDLDALRDALAAEAGPHQKEQEDE